MGELLRLDPDQPERAAESHLIADEVETGRLPMLLRRVDERLSAAVEDAEVTDQPLERRAIAGRCDHVVHQQPATVGQDGCAVLESLERSAEGDVQPGTGDTGIFIHPGHQFRLVDGLITNFHLPKSSLLLLVAAFAGRERVLAAYGEAVERGYRFYSYGDAMLIV